MSEYRKVKEAIALYELHKPTTLSDIFSLPSCHHVYLLTLMYRVHNCDEIRDIEKRLAEARSKRRSKSSPDVVESPLYVAMFEHLYGSEVVGAQLPDRYQPVVNYLSARFLHWIIETPDDEVLSLLKEDDIEVAYKRYLYEKGEGYYKTRMLAGVKDEVGLLDRVIDEVISQARARNESLNQALLQLVSDAIEDSHDVYHKVYKRINERGLLDA